MMSELSLFKQYIQKQNNLFAKRIIWKEVTVNQSQTFSEQTAEYEPLWSLGKTA